MRNEKVIGTLYVVATPIGNLGDITLRALDILKQVDRIAAEDTRHAGKLLKHFSLQKPMLSLHDFNERERSKQLITYLKNGESIALISDAGTPLISDPGYHLIKALREENMVIVPIPGACAAMAALSVAGLATDKFIFEGFLPVKAGPREQRLQQLQTESRTIIFYEAPHRLLETLHTLQKIFGSERKAVVARELTKIHESVLLKSLAELIQYYSSHPEQQRGEIVILVAGAEQLEESEATLSIEKTLTILLAELPLKQAVQLTVQLTGARKNSVYELALKLSPSR